MRNHTIMISALALALAVPATSMADTQGQGRGNGQGPAEQAGGDHGSAHGDHGNGRGDGNGSSERGQPAAREADRGDGNGHNGRGGQGRAERDQGRDHTPGNRVEVTRPGNSGQNGVGNQGRDGQGPRRAAEDDAVILHDRVATRGLVEGCPPGLAWRDNGCLPPGQARRLESDAGYDWLWNRSRDDVRYTYVDGYLYQTRSDGGLSGWLPLLGGALGLNHIWPQQYGYQPVPTYYSRYSGLGDRYDYRYANGVVYGVDPQTQAIQQVAALLTGQSWNVGQAMPRGYDAYNVPSAYREQYKDTPDRWYRYNDGYVYQVDPTTRLVQAVIQLLS